MKNSSRDKLQEIAERIGNERASELDCYASDQNRAELKEQISDSIIFRKKGNFPKRLTVIVAALLALLLLVGGMTIYKLNFGFADNGTHSTLTPLITNSDFRYMVEVPASYQISEVAKMQTLSRVTFVSGDDLIVFTESKIDLSIAVDTENAYTEITGLSGGYERFYIDKNGTTAIWRYGNYYYELYVSNSDMDILAIALTLAKL